MTEPAHKREFATLNPQLAELHTADLPALTSILETTKSVSYLGVELPKAAAAFEHLIPNGERFARHVYTEDDLRLMQTLAVSFDLGQSLLLEGGTGLGKSDAVKLMCKQLGWECYVINCHDMTVDRIVGRTTTVKDTESRSGFGWMDGVGLQAVRATDRPCRRVLLLEEYNFLNADTRASLHPLLDAVANREKYLIVPENNGEAVKIDHNTRIIALQNPPGGKFTDRDLLDAAQFNRFHYVRLPTEFSPELRRARGLGVRHPAYGKDNRELFLAQAVNFDHDKFEALPEYPDFIERFVDFTITVEKMVESRQLAKGQHQPLYFSFQRDLNRVVDYAVRYFDGDIYTSAKKALSFYYVNCFESAEDRAKVQELIERFEPVTARKSRRKSLALGTPAEGQAATVTALPPIEAGPALKPLPHFDVPLGISADEECQYETMQYLQTLYKRRFPLAVLAKGLTGLDIRPAWEWRGWFDTEIGKELEKYNVAASLAGIQTKTADAAREQWAKRWVHIDLGDKKKTGHLLAKGLCGSDNDLAWFQRLAGEKTPAGDARPFFDYVSKSEMGEAIIGLESPQAENVRKKLGLAEKLISYRGSDSPEAWAAREEALQSKRGFWRKMLNRELLVAAAESVAFLDNERAQKFRERMERLLDKVDDKVSLYRGIGGELAFARREQFLKEGASPAKVARSLTGVFGPRAGAMRDDLIKLMATMDDVAQFCEGLYASYDSAPIMLKLGGPGITIEEA